MAEIIEIDPDNLEALARGGVVACPTETFYGLAADALSVQAVERVYRIKGRDFNSPLPLIIGDERELPLLVTEIPFMARRLMATFWPGPLTIVFFASAAVPPLVTADTGKVGIRVSSHPIVSLLARSFGRPLTATSANASGSPAGTSADEVLRSLGQRIDVLLDGGRTPGGLGSTVLDATTRPHVIIRQGAIPGASIQAILDGQSF
jgi:L-threonylcarbamoyladenylate synthase